MEIVETRFLSSFFNDFYVYYKYGDSMNIELYNEVRKSLESLTGNLAMLKIYLEQVTTPSEFYDFINEADSSIIEKYQLTPDMLKEIFFDLVSEKFYSLEEIEQLKENAKRGANQTFVSNMHLLRYLQEDEITLENLSRCLNKKLSPLEFSVVSDFIRKGSPALNTIQIDFIDDEYINLFGNDYERLASFAQTQDILLKVLKDFFKFSLFKRILSYFKETDASSIEKVCIQIEHFSQTNPNLLEIFQTAPNQEEMNRLVAYFLLCQTLHLPIHSNSDLTGYEAKVDMGLEDVIEHTKNIEVLKQSILERFFKISLEEAIVLQKRYGLNIESLAHQESLNYSYVEIMIEIKNILFCNDLEQLRNYYAKKKQSNFQNSIDIRLNIEKKLREVFNKSFVNAVNNSAPNKEVVEDNKEDGYRIVKISGNYQKIVSVIDAFGDSEYVDDIQIVEKLHGNFSKLNHARCYSMMSASNPGIYHTGYNPNAVIIAIDNFSPQAILAASNKDIGSSSTANISHYIEDFLTYNPGDKFTDSIRDGYSELVIENEKNEIETRVSSFVCMDNVNRETIQSAKDLSKRYHKQIDIEIIDTRELIMSHMEYISSEYQNFLDTLDVQHLINFIRQILNTYSAFHKIRKYQEFFESDEFSMGKFRNLIKEALVLLHDNTESKRRLEEYLQMERNFSSLVTLVTPEQIENGFLMDSLVSVQK